MQPLSNLLYIIRPGATTRKASLGEDRRGCREINHTGDLQLCCGERLKTHTTQLCYGQPSKTVSVGGSPRSEIYAPGTPLM